MSEIVDLHRADDPRDVIHRAVLQLAEGKLAGLPLETGYVLTAHLLQPQAVSALSRYSGEEPIHHPFLCLRRPGEILDYVPHLSLVGQRLIRRCWPGPVILETDVGPDGLFTALPEETQRALSRAGRVCWGCFASEVVLSVSQLLPAPPGAVVPSGAPTGVVSSCEQLQSLTAAVCSFCIDSGPPRFTEPATVVRLRGDQWEVLHEGVLSARAIARLTGEIIVFVCTGNTCRSPMAEGLFRKYLAESLKCEVEELEDRGYVVLSAGLSAVPGIPVSPASVVAVQRAGVDIHGHFSQQLTPQMVQKADRIYTMTRHHRDAIVTSYPEAASKTELLSRKGRDISDPIGQGQEAYDRCKEEIEEAVRLLVQQLRSPR